MNKLEVRLSELGAEVEYTLTLTIDGTEERIITSYSQEGIQGEFGKLDTALKEKINALEEEKGE
jgi:hypothetical protein